MTYLLIFFWFIEFPFFNYWWKMQVNYLHFFLFFHLLSKSISHSILNFALLCHFSPVSPLIHHHFHYSSENTIQKSMQVLAHQWRVNHIRFKNKLPSKIHRENDGKLLLLSILFTNSQPITYNFKNAVNNYVTLMIRQATLKVLINYLFPGNRNYKQNSMI